MKVFKEFADLLFCFSVVWTRKYALDCFHMCLENVLTLKCFFFELFYLFCFEQKRRVLRVNFYCQFQCSMKT